MSWPSPGPARARRQDGSETICLSCSPARCELIIIFRPNRRCLWYYRIHLPPPTSQPPAHTSDWKYQIKAHILIVPSQYYRMELDNLNKKMKNWFKIVQFYSICWQDWLTGAWLCLVKEKERERDIPSPAQPRWATQNINKTPWLGQEGLIAGISDNRLLIKFLIILSLESYRGTRVVIIKKVKYGSELIVELNPRSPRPS